MLLDKKSYDLLDYLIKLEKPETIMTISKNLDQSRRKIYYHLEKINDSLPETVPKIVAIPRVGIQLSLTQVKSCKDLLKNVSDYYYVLKCDERMKLSAICIATSTQRVTIDTLMELTDVSRNTVLNDLNELREQLSQKDYSISLLSKKAKGYYFDCHPLSYIQFLHTLLDDIYRGTNTTFIEIFDKKTNHFLGTTTYFSQEVQDFFRNYLPISQANLGKKLTRPDSQFMVQILPFVLLSYRNMQYGKQVKETLEKDFSLIWKRKEYYIAKDLAHQLFINFKLFLDDIEVGLVAMLLLSFRKDKDNHVDSPDYDEMRVTLYHFIKVLEDRHHLQFTHEQELVKQLIRHCKALIYRKHYGISSVNPMTKHIKEKYADLYQCCHSAASILEEAWQLSLAEDDIAYITIHLGGELRNSKSLTPPKRLVIISDDGIGIQKLLYKQCQQLLTNSQIDAVLTTEQYKSIEDLLSVDYIITTNDDLDSNESSIVVNPILTDDNIVHLVNTINRASQVDNLDFSEKINQIVAPLNLCEAEQFAIKNQIEKLLWDELVTSIQVYHPHQ